MHREQPIVTESPDELKALLKHETNRQKRQRLHALYLFATASDDCFPKAELMWDGNMVYCRTRERTSALTSPAELICCALWCSQIAHVCPTPDNQALHPHDSI
jgi:hypothetical protein